MSNLLIERSAQMAKRSLLPREYQQVEYIESTGTQWIDTGIIPDTTTIAEYEFSISSFDRVWRALLTSKIGDKKNAFLVSFNNSSFVIGFGDNNSVSFPISNLQANKKYKLVQSKSFVKINNVIYNYPSAENELSSNLSLGLFCQNIDNLHDRFFFGKMYTCKIYKNNLKIADYIPCYKIADNKAGVYNTVSKTFISSFSYTNFIAGPSV